MPIKVGDRLPETKFRVMTSDGPAWKSTDDIFKGKKVALFAVPGAFTGTCHKMHVPSITQHADAIKAKGVNTVALTSVNDVFVMDAWKKSRKRQARSRCRAATRCSSSFNHPRTPPGGSVRRGVAPR